MNTSYLIFQLICIHNPPKLIVLTPLRSPYFPFANYANTFVDCVNTSTNFINTSIDYANESTNHGHTFDDCANIFIDSTNTHDTPTLDLCIPNLSLMRLLLNNFFII